LTAPCFDAKINLPEIATHSPGFELGTTLLLFYPNLKTPGQSFRANRQRREQTTMGLYTFQRQFRTTSSEGYEIREDNQRIGRVDLHFALENVYATIVLETEMDEAEVAQVIEEIDDNLVVTASVKREDLNVWVYQGREVGFYTDDFLDEAFGGEDEEELSPVENAPPLR